MIIGATEMIWIMLLPLFALLAVVFLILYFFRKINRLSEKISDLNNKLDILLKVNNSSEERDIQH